MGPNVPHSEKPLQRVRRLPPLEAQPPVAWLRPGRYCGGAMDTIRIDGLELRCIVGVRSYERRREQPVRIDVRLGLDLSSAGRSGFIHDTADYAVVADEVTALLRFREYRLLEVAAEEAAAMLLASHPAVQEVGIRLDKPQALAGRARGASVEITRTRGAYNQVPEPKPYGARQELLSGPEAVLELCRIDGGRTMLWEEPTEPLGARPALRPSAGQSPSTSTTAKEPVSPAGDSVPLRRLEWLVSGTLGNLPGDRTPIIAPPGSAPTEYRNPLESPALLFRCIARGPTVLPDEIPS